MFEMDLTVASLKSIAEKTSADDKSIGFEYQYYYFLDKLLNLKSGQSVGLEVEDDVHVEFNADFLLLFQLKHTVQKAVSGQSVALAELDVDLWKTIHNWSSTITDNIQNRSTIEDQLNFVRKTEFHLITNKSQSKTNNYLSLVEKFQSDETDFETVNAAAKALHDKSTNAEIKGYISTFLGLDKSVAKLFVKRLYVELSVDDMVNRVKSSIRDKFIDPTKIDGVYERLDSNIRQDNFITIKAGEPIIISYEQLMQRYRHIFTDARSKYLPAPNFNPVLPDDLFTQIFIKRLLEVQALNQTDSEKAVELTLQKLRIVRYLEYWVQSGDLITDEVIALHDEVYFRWRNGFEFAFRSCSTNQQIIDCAVGLLVKLRDERYKLGPSELNTMLSNGELYYLSDVERIGWHRDWEQL